MTGAAESVVVPVALPMARAFLLRGEGRVLVDAGAPGAGRRLLAGLKQAGVEPGQVRLIIITHGHSDHFGGLAEVRAATGARVAIGRTDAEALRTGRSLPLNVRGLYNLLFKLVPNRGCPGIEPDVLVDDELDLHGYGVGARVIATPGHTAGSLSVVTDDGEAIIGDLLLGNMMVGRTPTIVDWAWSKEASVASIRKVLACSPKIVRATHGGPFNPDVVRRMFQ